MNYSGLSITADISSLKNRQTIRSGETIEAELYTQTEVTGLKSRSRRLDYKPKGLEIRVDTTGTGSNFVQYSVGIENLVRLQVLTIFSTSWKIVREQTATTPHGSIFRRVYYPYKPIRVRVKINDSIICIEAALMRLNIRRGQSTTLQFVTGTKPERWQGWSRHVVTLYWRRDSKHRSTGWKRDNKLFVTGIQAVESIKFLIQKFRKVQEKMSVGIIPSNAVQLCSELLNFPNLQKRSEKLMIDVSEVIDIIQNVEQTIKILEFYSWTKRTKLSRAWTVLEKGFWKDFTAEDAWT